MAVADDYRDEDGNKISGYEALWNKAKGLFDDSQDQKDKRAAIDAQANAAGGFANQGQANYSALGAEGDRARQMLWEQANGGKSVSGEMLRQGLAQQVAQQRSLAAGASPQNSAMAARTAANNIARSSYGMSGQAAVAGMQEKMDAQKALQQSILQQRQQDAQVALGSRQNAMQAYKDYDPEKQGIQKWGGAIGSVFKGIFSDRNLKTEIEDGDEKAAKMLSSLKAYSYKYKDQAHGKGEQFGPMAQDLEAAGLGHTVVNTPKGKMVDTGRAALSGLALTASLAKRVTALEGKRK